jgi:hypothetical protein
VAAAEAAAEAALRACPLSAGCMHMQAQALLCGHKLHQAKCFLNACQAGVVSTCLDCYYSY